MTTRTSSTSYNGQYYNVEDQRITEDSRYTCDQAAKQGAALRGAFGVEAQVLVLSEVYKRLQAEGLTDTAAAIRAHVAAGELTLAAITALEALKRLDAPTTEERAVCAVLETTADDAQALADRARARGDKAAAKDWQRASNASRRALQHYRDGVRPEQLPRGTWIARSQRPGGEPHLMWWMPRGWSCSCQSAGQPHWATALVEAIHRAGEMMEQWDDTPRWAA